MKNTRMAALDLVKRLARTVVDMMGPKDSITTISQTTPFVIPKRSVHVSESSNSGFQK